MGTYIVRGGRRIEGEWTVRGSKNATLPILAASLLAEDEVMLENIPLIRDVLQTLDILRELGCRVERTGRTVVIDSRRLCTTESNCETVRKMRSSILFLGALLGREKQAKVAYPRAAPSASVPSICTCLRSKRWAFLFGRKSF